MTLHLHVSSIMCDGCADTVTKAIKTLDANATVHVDVASKTVSIDTQTSEAEVTAAIAAAGHVVAGG